MDRPKYPEQDPVPSYKRAPGGSVWTEGALKLHEGDMVTGSGEEFVTVFLKPTETAEKMGETGWDNAKIVRAPKGDWKFYPADGDAAKDEGWDEMSAMKFQRVVGRYANVKQFGVK